MGNIETVGPNEALIVSGGLCTSTDKQFVVGGWCWTWWLITDVQRMSLQIMTLKPQCDNVETAQGVPLSVTGIAQCKIMNEPSFLSIAAEQFLGMSIRQIHFVLNETLEGHLRSILGTLTVEAIYRDRDQFAQLVREVANPDVGRMGIEIVSFTIQDVYDCVEYLSSLGKTRTAEVKRDAQAGVASAERDAGIREAHCNKESMDAKYGANTKIEDAHRLFSLEKAKYDGEVNTLKAEAQLAYELQSARIQQSIRNEEMEIEVVERRKQIDIQEKEIQRREKELMAQVKLPAEAEAYRVETVASGARAATVSTAQAEAQRIKLIGAAEAYGIEAVGRADAERMRMKAMAYKHFEDAAILSLTLEALPKIAAEVAAPLAKTDQIVLIGNNSGHQSSNGLVDPLTQLVSQLPPTIQALTGINLTGTLAKIPGAIREHTNSNSNNNNTNVKHIHQTNSNNVVAAIDAIFT
ncbi:flotillin-2-like [Oppia nitens]|uniref:flotillin-2-like n=1 Tax=Oppia nitens TaxID=1686743 RepID=UPI0023DCDCBE|nr:flotillin-2-like [Oppia nitens]